MKLKFENIMWGYALLLVGATWFSGLFIDLTGDAGLYAAISRQMVESGDWLNLKINGAPYDQKPHLLFWLAGAGIKIFGNTNFAFKIFPVLFGLTGVYFTFRLGKLLFSEEAGRWAALFAGTSQIFFLYFLDIHTDSVLQAGVTFSLWQLARYLKDRKITGFIFGFSGVGLAMLSKGPVGAVIPFFAVLFFLILNKDFRQLFHPKWLLGIIIILVIISPSLFHLYRNFGMEGIRFYFITNNFGRVSGEYAGSNTDYLFYFHTILWAFLPWTVFVAFALFSEIKSWKNKVTRDCWGVCLLGGVLVLTAILSIAKGKAPNYFLMAVSPVSVIAGRWVTRMKNLPPKKEKVLFWFQRVLLMLLAIVFVVVVFTSSGKNTWLFIVFILLGSHSFIGAFRFRAYNKGNILLHTLVIAGSLNLFMNVSYIPGLFQYQGARQALEIYEEEKGAGDRLVNLQLEEYELFYWANAPVENFTNWEDFYLFLENRGSWVYTNQRGYDVVRQLVPALDTVYEIPQRGMNEITAAFLNPATREGSLNNNYLIRVK